MIGGVVLVEIALVVGGVDDGLARRDVRGHAVAGEAAADAEHHVGLRQEVMDGPDMTPPPPSERQRMVLGKALLPRAWS